MTAYTRPRELGAATYSANDHVASTSTHGASLPSPWTFNFTVDDYLDVDVLIDIPYMVNTGNADSTAHVLIDGSCVLEDTIDGHTTFSSLSLAKIGRSVHRETRKTFTTGGSHSVEVKLATGTGGDTYIFSGSANKALLRVREAG